MARKLNFEEAPLRESMNPAKKLCYWDWDRRNGKDEMLTKVIENKLRAAIGRKWDDVYSELKPQVPERLQDCFLWYVAKGPDTNRWGYKMYVDENGILREPKKVSWPKRRPRPIVFLWLNKELHYLENNIWYKLVFDFWDKVWDKKGLSYNGWRALPDLVHSSITRSDAIRIWGRTEDPLICVNKLACDTKTIKKLNGLKAELEQ